MPNLGVPDVNTLVEGAAGKVPAVWAKGYAVDGLLVTGQCVDTHPTLNVPQTHRWVKWCAREMGGRRVGHLCKSQNYNWYTELNWTAAAEENSQINNMDMCEYYVHPNKH